MKTKDDVLAELKLQYEIKDSDGKLLSFITKAESKILNYCNVPCVWDALFQVWVDLSFDLLNASKTKISDEQRVKSISEGNTSVAFDIQQPKTEKDIFNSYQSQLNRFRRLNW